MLLNGKKKNLGDKMTKLKTIDNGFEYIEVINESACASIALQGAHLFHYSKKDEDSIFWLSECSDFEENKAIRGGVPICWPWFGENKNSPSLPKHGFARTSLWEYSDSKEIDSKTTKINLKLKDSKETHQFWPYKFELLLEVTIADKLTFALTTTNLDNKVFEITQALHSYFQISHISNVTVQGLDKKPYLDALDFENYKQDGDITFEKEIDRVYQEVGGNIILVDKNKKIKIENEGSSSVVVWNPWIEKTKKMSAMSSDAYKSFVCIESANAFDNLKILEPNESHTLKATIY